MELCYKGWFEIESKSFQISVTVLKGRVAGKILERNRDSPVGLGSEKRVWYLCLKGWRDCLLEVGKPFKKVWKELEARALQ